MNKTETGRLYTAILYQHSRQVLDVLLDNPELRESARSLFDRNKHNLAEVLNRQQAELSTPNELLSFLDEFANKSPLALKLQIYRIRNDLLTKPTHGE